MTKSPEVPQGWFTNLHPKAKYFLWGIIALVVIAGVIYAL